jgi:hypothetical protein
MEHDSKFDHRNHGDLSDLEERSFISCFLGELLFAAMAAVMFALVVVFVVLAFAI